MNKFPGLGSSNLHVEVLVDLFMTLPYLINIIVSCAKDLKEDLVHKQGLQPRSRRAQGWGIPNVQGSNQLQLHVQGRDQGPEQLGFGVQSGQAWTRSGRTSLKPSQQSSFELETSHAEDCLRAMDFYSERMVHIKFKQPYGL